MESSSLTNEEEDLLMCNTQLKEADNNMEAQPSYRDTVTQTQTFSAMDFDCTLFNNMSLEEEKDNTTNHPNFIPITSSDKNRLYEPWKKSLIIKLLGKRMSYNLLRTKIQNIWSSTELLNLVDLGNDFI